MPATTRTLTHVFEKACAAFPIQAGERIVVAVSGGSDSVCLLHLLRERAARHGLLLHVAHLNHQFRIEADDEARFVARLSEAWGIPVTVASLPVAALCKAQGWSKQEGARNVRYRFLEETAQRVGAKWIATGHTADDQAETFLMRLLRGAGPTGLAAIPRWRETQRATLIRPLLDVTRQTIVAELTRAGIAWVEDPSNARPTSLRNRIRHELLPILAQYNPRIKETLCREASLLRDEDDGMRAVALEQIATLARQHGEEILLNAAGLRALHPALQRRVLRWGIAQRTGVVASFDRIEALRQSLARPPGAVYMLPGGVRAERHHTDLILRRGAPMPPPPPAPIEIPTLEASVDAPAWRLRLRFTPSRPSRVSPDCAVFDRDKVTLPMTLRAWQPGDRFMPSGMKGRKKVQDFFVDKKIPRGLRHTLPILACPVGILWIVGHRTDAAFQATPDTAHVLTVHVEWRDAASPGCGDDGGPGFRPC